MTSGQGSLALLETHYTTGPLLHYWTVANSPGLQIMHMTTHSCWSLRNKCWHMHTDTLNTELKYPHFIAFEGSVMVVLWCKGPHIADRTPQMTTWASWHNWENKHLSTSDFYAFYIPTSHIHIHITKGWALWPKGQGPPACHCCCYCRVLTRQKKKHLPYYTSLG